MERIHCYSELIITICYDCAHMPVLP